MVDAESDEDLMLRVASGDRRAFTVLFDRHQASVTRFAYRFVGDKGRAEELAQDIFVKLFRSASAYKPTAKLKTFLFRVATNHCLNEVRRGEYRMPRVKPPTQEGEPAEATTPSGDARPDEAMAAKELEAVVQVALAGMSERERAAFTMCRFEGMAYRDIAEALSATEAAVKSLIHRATLAVAKRVQELEAGAMPARSRA